MPLASVSPNDWSYIPCSMWQVTLVITCAPSNLRWVIGILPRQTGVYVPRRLSHVSGPATWLAIRVAPWACGLTDLDAGAPDHMGKGALRRPFVPLRRQFPAPRGQAPGRFRAGQCE
jgi:hypothetical protein